MIKTTLSRIHERCDEKMEKKCINNFTNSFTYVGNFFLINKLF